MMLYRWAVRTRMNINVPAALLTIMSFFRPLASCPSICICNSTHSDCSSSFNLQISFNSILNQLPPNLTSLTISENNITMIKPQSFANLSSLLRLDLSRNNLLSLHRSTFYQLSSLEFLDLSSNFLLNLPVDLLSDLISLRELVLRDNRINMLSPIQFHSLTQLQHLDLSFNSLDSLPLGLLDGLQALVWLSLAGNKIGTLQRSVLEPLTVLQHLQLEENNWNCSCSIIPFKHWLEWMLYRGGHVDSIQCSLPAILRGRDLRRVPMEMFRHCSQLPIPETRHHSASCFRTADGLLVSTDPAADCYRQRHKTVSVRRAPITVVVAGVVCAVVCVMMVVAATYGCIYAMLAAHHQQQLLERSLQVQQQPLMDEREAEPEEEETAPDLNEEEKAPECTEWIAFPPEVCV
ncbi:leucine-rich repeat and transmembrane domain-containing protein 2-like [Astyanax mexicanus]|uniref:Leucine-rich repeat and transmembrane domain-containing protein 2-like n=1 Tax=Astyanax mexicanus TaxID=7994 RepID=A0A8B9LBC3_ASTMX|nr:leucine-rich repeat and transmembrane domain-containing protein 2-like [Astyanax mexicanus]